MQPTRRLSGKTLLREGGGKQLKATFLSVVATGILAHGMALFNKFSVHDDIGGIFSTGASYPLGRWMLGLIDIIVKQPIIGGWFSVPLFGGAILITTIAIAACLIVRMFNVDNLAICCVIGAAMISYPGIASTFGYMFVAPLYGITIALCVFGTYLICIVRRWPATASGIIIIAIGTAIYQAYIPFCVSMMLLFFLKQSCAGKSWNWFLKNAAYYLICCIGFLAIYFLANSIALNVTGTTLSSYKGVNTMGSTSLEEYFHRSLYAYEEFFFRGHGGISTWYPRWWILLYRITLVLSIAMGTLALIRQFGKSISTGLQALLLALLFPLCANLIFVMVDPSYVGANALMTYGDVSSFILTCCLANAFLKGSKSNRRYTAALLLSGWSAIALCACLCFSFCRFDNVCYLKADFLQEQAKSYCTALTTRIQGVEGYRSDYPVVYINEFDKDTSTQNENKGFAVVKIPPYNVSTYINDYNWRFFMANWCGYNPHVLPSQNYSDNEEIADMPSYPNDGSIAIIDETVVVKF